MNAWLARSFVSNLESCASGKGFPGPTGCTVHSGTLSIAKECILSQGLSRDSTAENRPETQVFVDNDPATGV